MRLGIKNKLGQKEKKKPQKTNKQKNKLGYPKQKVLGTSKKSPDRLKTRPNFQHFTYALSLPKKSLTKKTLIDYSHLFSLGV